MNSRTSPHAFLINNTDFGGLIGIIIASKTMFTLLIVVIIALSIIVAYTKHKQEQIIGLTRNELLQKHCKAYSSYRNWLIFSIIIFFIGFLLSEFCDMYKTEEYEYWLFGTQKDTREVLTTEAWWSYILRFLGTLIGIPCLIGLIDRRNAINKYKTMSVNEYSSLQHKVHQDMENQRKQDKKVKTVNNIIRIFKLFNN